MEKVQYFLIGRIYDDSVWRIISPMTEEYSVAMVWYNEEMSHGSDNLYTSIKICSTIYG